VAGSYLYVSSVSKKGIPGRETLSAMVCVRDVASLIALFRPPLRFVGDPAVSSGQGIRDGHETMRFSIRAE